MRKIYDAFGKEKRSIIEDENDIRAHDRQYYQGDKIGLKDMVLVGRTNSFPFGKKIDIHWNLNGLIKDDDNLGDIIILEPLSEQINNSDLLNISEVDTYFSNPIKLSKKAIILMPLKKYDELCKKFSCSSSLSNLRFKISKSFFILKSFIDISSNSYLLILLLFL